ncbi:MAG: hypothetical protein MHMPM18_000026 [Marteilia pararefringens]
MITCRQINNIRRPSLRFFYRNVLKYQTEQNKPEWIMPDPKRNPQEILSLENLCSDFRNDSNKWPSNNRATIPADGQSFSERNRLKGAQGCGRIAQPLNSGVRLEWINRIQKLKDTVNMEKIPISIFTSIIRENLQPSLQFHLYNLLIDTQIINSYTHVQNFAKLCVNMLFEVKDCNKFDLENSKCVMIEALERWFDVIGDLLESDTAIFTNDPLLFLMFMYGRIDYCYKFLDALNNNNNSLVNKGELLENMERWFREFDGEIKVEQLPIFLEKCAKFCNRSLIKDLFIYATIVEKHLKIHCVGDFIESINECRPFNGEIMRTMSIHTKVNRSGIIKPLSITDIIDGKCSNCGHYLKHFNATSLKISHQNGKLIEKRLKSSPTFNTSNYNEIQNILNDQDCSNIHGIVDFPNVFFGCSKNVFIIKNIIDKFRVSLNGAQNILFIDKTDFFRKYKFEIWRKGDKYIRCSNFVKDDDFILYSAYSLDNNCQILSSNKILMNKQ